MRKLRILLIGRGGREAALDWAMRNSPHVETVLCAPGNGGIDPARRRKVDLTDPHSIVHLALVERIDLVVVGPEAPLVAGLADMLQEHRIFVFGPDKFCAQLEGSKAFTKRLCTQIGIPTGRYRVAHDFESAASIIRGFGPVPVIKADGLCDGKGAFVCASLHDAIDTAERILMWKDLGHAGKTLVIEERLHGVERTFLFACDGEHGTAFPAAQDFKRAGNGDVGPNTGGMGAFSPVTGVDDAVTEQIRRLFVEPVLRWCREQGHPYRGILYVGVMMTAEGPKLIEYNCRFGDPETQVILPRVKTDIVEVMLAASGFSAGGLSRLGPLEVSDEVTVGVVIAARGYPGTPKTGFRIRDLDTAAEHALVFHAGTERCGGEIVATGGRLLTLVGRGQTVADACTQAYLAADCIVRASPNVWCRTDIARELIAG